MHPRSDLFDIIWATLYLGHILSVLVIGLACIAVPSNLGASYSMVTMISDLVNVAVYVNTRPSHLI